MTVFLKTSRIIVPSDVPGLPTLFFPGATSSVKKLVEMARERTEWGRGPVEDGLNFVPSAAAFSSETPGVEGTVGTFLRGHGSPALGT